MPPAGLPNEGLWPCSLMMGRTQFSSNFICEVQNPCCPRWLMLLPMIDEACDFSHSYSSTFGVWTCLSAMIQGMCLLNHGFACCDRKTSTSPLISELMLEILAASGEWWCLQFLGAFTSSRPAPELASAQWHSDPVRVLPRLWLETWSNWIVTPRI